MENVSKLAAYFQLFSITTPPDYDYFFGQLIKCGLVGVGDSENGYDVLEKLIESLLRHNFKTDSVRESVFCIGRQLLALGFFRERGALFFHFYLQHYPVYALDDIQIANVRSLQTEFFRTALSLLQLSRTAIRLLVGTNNFEHRVRTLHLPPLLLKYVWRAAEMLTDNF